MPPPTAAARKAPLAFEALSKAIVKRLITDLSDRKGFDHMWDECDDDVQRELKRTWVGLVRRELCNPRKHK